MSVFRVPFAAFCLPLVCLLGCSSGELSRSKAEMLINASESARSSRERPLNLAISGDDKVKGEEAGIWETVDCGPGEGCSTHWRFKNGGEKVFAALDSGLFGNGRWAALLPGAQREVESVDGISSADGTPGAMMAEFTWRWKKGSVPDRATALAALSETRKGVAMFKKYGGGWRAEHVQWTDEDDGKKAGN